MADEAPLFELCDLLVYESDTGRLFWKRRPDAMFPTPADAARWNGRYAGAEALTATSVNGYRHGVILGRPVKAHSVAWAITYGSWPKEIDHINGTKDDNRIANLRCVTRRENSKNRSLRSDNQTGAVGISRRRGKWLARIQADDRAITLGTFGTLQEAIRARKEAEALYGYHENHGRSQ